MKDLKRQWGWELDELFCFLCLFSFDPDQKVKGENIQIYDKTMLKQC